MRSRSRRVEAGPTVVLGLGALACAGGAETSGTGGAAATAAAGAGEGAAPSSRLHWTSSGDIGTGLGTVTDAILGAGTADPPAWLHYHGDYANFRHSPIRTLTPAAMSSLEVAWTFPTGTAHQFEASPIVYDGVLYVSSSFNRVFALAFDVASGDEVWRFRLGAGVRSQPIEYEVEGETFVAIGAGNGRFGDATGAPTIMPEGGELFVFRLPWWGVESHANWARSACHADRGLSGSRRARSF